MSLQGGEEVTIFPIQNVVIRTTIEDIITLTSSEVVVVITSIQGVIP
jgi:hypothetical protein